MKLIGYSLAVLGLATVALSKFISALPLIKSLAKPELYSIIGGFVLIAAGIALVLSDSSSSSKVKQAANEVPIYEGTGKKRKIVGYQKAE